MHVRNRTRENRVYYSQLIQLEILTEWDVTRDVISFSLSSCRASLISFVLMFHPGELRQDWIPNAVVRVAREGDGDGIASAPVNLLHPMEVL